MYVLGRIERAAAIAAAAFLVQFGVGDPTRAQQLHKGVTGPQCAAMGGRITTWTNTQAVVQVLANAMFRRRAQAARLRRRLPEMLGQRPVPSVGCSIF
jgi:hypothetical protein